MTDPTPDNRTKKECLPQKVGDSSAADASLRPTPRNELHCRSCVIPPPRVSLRPDYLNSVLVQKLCEFSGGLLSEQADAPKVGVNRNGRKVEKSVGKQLA